MKSIMADGSTILKAVEKAWSHAGKPQEFSVKIYEDAEHNFFGMTTKKAKIGLFFEAKSITAESAPSQKKAAQPRKQMQRKQTRQPRTKRPQQQTQRSRERVGNTWSDEMVTMAQDWLKGSLSLLGLPNITFTTKAQGKSLKFTMSSSVTGDKSSERILYSSFAHLILATIKNKYKREFRDLKVIITNA